MTWTPKRIVHPEAGELEFSTLKEFICSGKRAGWASGAKPTKLSDGTKHYEHTEGELKYTDDFIGQGRFIGREVVRFKGVPVWGMNYTDIFWTPQEYTSDLSEKLREQVFGFLKERLNLVEPDAPFRGPIDSYATRIVDSGKIMYYNRLSAPTEKEYEKIIKFSGREEMSFDTNDKSIFPFICFSLDYHGRVLIPDEYIKE
ncbi:MAG: DUF5680 domain-containing protein [archaeon]